jgi:hypothetical protein
MEAARRLEMSQTTIAKWQKQFLDGGPRGPGSRGERQAAGFEAGGRPPSQDRGAHHGARRGLRGAPGVAKRGALYPQFEDLERIRREVGMSVRRFCSRLKSPPSTWYYWRASHVHGREVRRWPARWSTRSRSSPPRGPTSSQHRATARSGPCSGPMASRPPRAR